MFYFLIIFLCFYNIESNIIPEKVVICGVCKNVQNPLPYTIKIIENIGSLFKDYRVIVYENNSIDSTVNILKKWQNKNSKIKFYSENINQKNLTKVIINKCKGDFFRPELIARARNIVLDKAMSSEYEDFQYIIWMDMDFTIPPHLNGIIEVFKANKEWDAVFANGISPASGYWDWYAFRDNVDPLGPELLGHDWYVPKHLSFNKTDDWYPVYSAFGGCGIYKKSSIQGCRYSALVTKDLEIAAKKIINTLNTHPKILKYFADLNKLTSKIFIDHPRINLSDISDSKVGVILQNSNDALVWKMNSFTYKYPTVCEHVTFHASMIANGHDKLFVNPRMVFTYNG